ncbi:hypothetical protein [Lysinibacillus agricola]|uniref:hypothetical protein n=1 Tax=Lysinibacillus agricola TaxID=2590012 RepID=UPI003C26F677
MATLFLGVWIGVTLPILLSFVFELLKPIAIVDVTGISFIIVGLIIGILDAYIGFKIFENIIQTWLEKRKR